MQTPTPKMEKEIDGIEYINLHSAKLWLQRRLQMPTLKHVWQRKTDFVFGPEVFAPTVNGKSELTGLFLGDVILEFRDGTLIEMQIGNNSFILYKGKCL